MPTERRPVGRECVFNAETQSSCHDGVVVEGGGKPGRATLRRRRVGRSVPAFPRGGGLKPAPPRLPERRTGTRSTSFARMHKAEPARLFSWGRDDPEYHAIRGTPGTHGRIQSVSSVDSPLWIRLYIVFTTL